MKYGSVCSGIEAATVAWHNLGWEPQWFSEIEQFPSDVLKHRFPTVPNLGDMTTINQNPIADERPIDLLVGGTPCQSFSVAGLRKGLDDPRGNLMLTFLSIADKLRPKWIVWENVPGVLSSNGGKDFGTFLGALGELGYGFAYRVLDAQHFGVAQRRRRVFVVGYLGDWRVAAAVLFERESLQGNTKPSRKKREEVTANAEGSVGEAGSWWDGSQVAGTLTKQNANGAQRMPDKDNFGAILQQPFRKVRRAQSDSDFETWEKDETANTINCFDVGDVRSTNVVAQPISIDWRTAQVDQGITQTLKTDLAKMSGPCIAVDVYNQKTTGDKFGVVREQHGTNMNAVLQPIAVDTYNYTTNDHTTQTIRSQSDTEHIGAVLQPMAFDWQSGGDMRGMNLQEKTQLQRCQTPAVMHSIDFRNNRYNEEQIAGTLQSKESGGYSLNYTTGVHQPPMAIRRLTPKECERLQGFPDDWTRVPYRNKDADQCPDGPRYKACGNSMAVPVMRWIGQRIQLIEKIINE
jgi:DNA (cytosine-5)-methyltransferase 1